MCRVLGIGDNVCDVYLKTNMMYPGGQALNFSVYAKKLGADSAYMGVFGTDEIAKHVQNVIDSMEIDRDFCRSYVGENGFALVTIENGDRVFKGSNRGGVLRQHPLELSEEDLHYISTFDVVHTSNNSYLDSQLNKLSKLESLVSYDFSLSWVKEERLDLVAPYIDFAFLSCGKLTVQETYQLCKHINQLGCAVVTATRGEKSAIVYDGSNFFHQTPDFVKVVDTMGAGDSFAAAMLVGIGDAQKKDGKEMWQEAAYREKKLQHILKEAAEFSAKTCLTLGAFGMGTAIPTGMEF